MRAVPSFLCAFLFQSVCVRVCFLRQHEINLWYLPGTACLYSGPSPVYLACLRNHLLHACRYGYCGCHLEGTAVGKDITHYSFSSIPAVVYGFSSNMRSKFVGLRRIVLVFISIFYATRTRYFSCVLVWYVHTRCTLHEANQGCCAVSCTSFSYWGACWSKVLVRRTHIISYVCTWGLLLLIIHWNISFFCRYLVVGSRYDFFFSVSIVCGATHAGRILFDTKRKRENSRGWLFEVRVMLLLDRSRTWTILSGTKLWIACGHNTVVCHC